MVNLDEVVNLAYSVVPPNTPVDSGNLLNSITTRALGTDKIETILNATSAVYGIWLDDASGHVKQHKGFFTEKIYNAQVDIINQYLTGQVSPLGQQLQQGLVGEMTPAQEQAYLNSVGAYEKYYGGNE